VRSALFMFIILMGCGHNASPPAASKESAPERTRLLGAVGPHPRGFATLSLHDPALRTQGMELEAELRKSFGKQLSDCNIALERLDQFRIAVGEPLRIAAELDGKIDVHAVSCVVGGDPAMQALTRAGVVVRDRPGGIAIDYHVALTQDERAHAAGTDLASRCTDVICAAIVLGPPNRPLWVQVRVRDRFQLELSGPSLGRAAVLAVVAAIDGLRQSSPELSLLNVREQHGALIVELPRDPSILSMIAAALTLRTQLLEAFKVPSSSMVPTLLVDDQFFVAKGPLLGALVPGDLVVYRQGDTTWVKRYLAGPGQTIAESESGISIDGKPLTTEIVDPSFHYKDRDGDSDQLLERSGSVVREHLGARGYLTLRTGPARATGTWTVPAGQVFFVGDNRNNSNDSRYLGASPNDVIVGRVLGVWLAFRDGAPDWDRMGVPIE
jgi:signal peptidase I